MELTALLPKKQGFSGKDSVRIADGTFEIISGGDAIHSENEEDENKGFVYMADGTFTLNALAMEFQLLMWFSWTTVSYEITAVAEVSMHRVRIR